MPPSLPARLIVLTGVAVLIAAVLFLTASASAVRTFEDALDREHQRFAAAIAKAVSTELEHDLGMVSATAGAVDESAQHDLLATTLQFSRIASAAFIAGTDGSVTACSPESECGALPPAALAAAVRGAIASNRPFVTGAGDPIVAVVPFRTTSPRSAAAGIALRPASRQLTNLVEASRDHSRTALVDANGLALTGDAAAIGGGSVIVPVDGTPWTIHLQPAAEERAPVEMVRRRAAWFGTLLAALAAVVMLFAWGMSREIERVNRELETRVELRTRDLAAATARRQQLLRKVISAQEDERKRVARELHDELSQTLAALGMARDMTVVRQLASRMTDELHRLIMNLRPSVLDDLGLAAAIRWLADRELSTRGIAVRCEISDADVPLDDEVETALFRAVQEAIVNIGRHSGAETVLIQVGAEGNTLAVEIEDDGVGFEVESVGTRAESLRGVGLMGMRERLDIIGGTLRIDSTPGSGTRIVMTVPVDVRTEVFHEPVSSAHR